MLHHSDQGSQYTSEPFQRLMADHGILTQVAGHHMDVIKLLPPLNLTRADADHFLAAFESVVAGLERFPGPAWDLVTRIGKFTLGADARKGAA